MASNLVEMASNLVARACTLVAMASTLVAMASNLLEMASNLIEVASTLVAMASNLVARACTLVAMASTLVAMASNLLEMASNLVEMASTLVAMASTLVAMASTLVAMASTLVEMAFTLVAMASTLVEMASNLVAMASTLVAMASTLVAMASTLVEMASNLVEMASTLVAMASTLVEMASTLVAMASTQVAMASNLVEMASTLVAMASNHSSNLVGPAGTVPCAPWVDQSYTTSMVTDSGPPRSLHRVHLLGCHDPRPAVDQITRQWSAAQVTIVREKVWKNMSIPGSPRQPFTLLSCFNVWSFGGHIERERERDSFLSFGGAKNSLWTSRVLYPRSMGVTFGDSMSWLILLEASPGVKWFIGKQARWFPPLQFHAKPVRYGFLPSSSPKHGFVYCRVVLRGIGRERKKERNLTYYIYICNVSFNCHFVNPNGQQNCNFSNTTNPQ